MVEAVAVDISEHDQAAMAVGNLVVAGAVAVVAESVAVVIVVMVVMVIVVVVIVMVLAKKTERTSI